MPTFVTDDAVTLSYLDEGSGPVVVLIAGFTAPATTWALQQGPLVAAGYRVLALDRRGHGDSDAPDHGATMARHGQDVDNFLAALEVETAVLCGGSMGAATAWSYVHQFGTGRVRGVVSVDQTPKMINDAGWSNGFYGLTDANIGTFFDDGVPSTGRGRPQYKSLPSMIKLISKLRRMPTMASSDTPPMKALLRDHAVQDWRSVIASVDVPVLTVAGRDSQLWPFSHASEAVANNPLGQFVVLDHCGHFANLDQWKSFNAALLNFLESLGS